MKIRAGYDISYQCPQPTPMLLELSIHPSRIPDLATPHQIVFDSPIRATEYIDSFGSTCTRIVAPRGSLRISADFIVRDSGKPDVTAPDATQIPVEELPDEVMIYLLGSRYCDTDLLSATAWKLFAGTPPGWARVQAICDHVNERLRFGYEYARPTRTAWDGFHEQLGVCRDFAHLAITLCRCMNLPARYCTGYLGDIGVVPPDDTPMDFSAWFEVYLGGSWYTFDARHNTPRIGRILMARGRDATDVALTTTFGPCTLMRFNVHTEEVLEG
jgi:transglutaminase-like putative cysteine protease